MTGGFILDMGCKIECPHKGKVVVTPGNTRVKGGGNLLLLVTDSMTIAGCTFTLPNGQLSPCISILWKNEAKKVKINRTAVLLDTSIGFCQNAQKAPQGTVLISGVQQKVKGE